MGQHSPCFVSRTWLFFCMLWTLSIFCLCGISCFHNLKRKYLQRLWTKLTSEIFTTIVISSHQRCKSQLQLIFFSTILLVFLFHLPWMLIIPQNIYLKCMAQKGSKQRWMSCCFVSKASQISGSLSVTVEAGIGVGCFRPITFPCFPYILDISLSQFSLLFFF